MPLDPSILSQGKPFQTPDPLQNYSKILQIQAAQSQNALTQNQLGAAKRGEEGQNALSRAQQAAYDPETGAYDMNKLRGSMISGGFGALLPDVEKKMGDLRTQQLAQQKAEGEVVAGRTKQFRDLLTNVNNPSAAAQWLQAQYKDPILGPVVSRMPLDQALAEIPTDPAKFNEWRSRNALGMEEFIKQNKPTTFETGTGQVTQRMSMPGLGGAATVVPGSTMQQVATPAQIEQGRRDQQRLGLEGQRVGLERERVGIARTEAERKTQGLEALPPKEIQKREAVLPQATAAVKGFEAKATSFVQDLTALRNHPGLSEITGIAAGRLPGITKEGRAAQALYDKVVAKGGFQALQDLRDASKTGGALGNVSNTEGKQLTASFAAVDRRQNASDVQAAIDQAISDVEGAKVRMREAYDSTYSYKTPAVPAGGFKFLGFE